MDFDGLERRLRGDEGDEGVIDALKSILVCEEFDRKTAPRFMKLALSLTKSEEPSIRYYAKKVFAKLRYIVNPSDLPIILPETFDELDVDENEWMRSPTFVYGTRQYWMHELDNADFKIRVKAIMELCSMKAEEARERLFSMLEEEKEEFVLATLVKYLAHYGDERYAASVMPFLRHSDPRVRANAVEGLEVAKAKDAVPYVAELIRDPDNRVKANALRFISSFEPRKVEEELWRMIESSEVWMLDSALYLIGKLKPPSAMEMLRRIAECGEEEPAAEARALMERIRAGADGGEDGGESGHGG